MASTITVDDMTKIPQKYGNVYSEDEAIKSFNLDKIEDFENPHSIKEIIYQSGQWHDISSILFVFWEKYPKHRQDILNFSNDLLFLVPDSTAVSQLKKIERFYLGGVITYELYVRKIALLLSNNTSREKVGGFVIDWCRDKSYTNYRTCIHTRLYSSYYDGGKSLENIVDLINF